MTDRRRELRAAFIEARGFWTPLWEGLLLLVSVIGINSCAVGVPILVEEVGR